MWPNTARACAKTRWQFEKTKKRSSHLRCGAFLFSRKVIQTTFSFSKTTLSEFSHELSLEPTRASRLGSPESHRLFDISTPRGSALDR
jgi:hypothetical protein